MDAERHDQTVELRPTMRSGREPVRISISRRPLRADSIAGERRPHLLYNIESLGLEHAGRRRAALLARLATRVRAVTVVIVGRPGASRRRLS
jgi:hypothetical protein